MKNISFICLLMLFTIGCTNIFAQVGVDIAMASDTLKPGDFAPPIQVRKWIKGTPVTKFKPGMVYVVEFWATWCGPCQMAMPHLSELAKKYKGKAEILSIDVRERTADFLPKVERFVKYSGDRMNYTVAVDATGDVMHTTWLKAAGSTGIPHLFIVDQQGRIAWQGHPNYIDDVLEAVVNGDYHEACKKRIEAVLQEKEVRYDSLQKKLTTARRNGEYSKALAVLEEIMPLFPANRMYLLMQQYELLSRIDSVSARQLGETLMGQWSPKDQLGFVTLILYAQLDSSWKPDYGFALKWAKQAVARCDPEDNGVKSILALAYYKTGKREQAVKCQEKYIQLLKKDATVKPIALEQAEKVLAQYKS